MNKTKQKILNISRELYNEYGISNVSIRMISRELKISHSNLIYHFEDKNALIEQLHQEILKEAINLNKSLEKEENILNSLLLSIEVGFKIIYENRFFMIDLNLIMRENKKLHQQFLEIEELRFKMYREKIDALILENIFRKQKHENEYANLITQIRILSDYWVSSALIYDADKTSEEIIIKYAKLLKEMFFPYLTKQGEKEFLKLTT